MENKQERTTERTIVLGANGTGKTTIINKILTGTPYKSLVITPDDVEWRQYPENELQTSDDFRFEGINRHIFNPDSKKAKDKTRCTLDQLKYFNRGNLVFDDCRAYLLAATDLRIRQVLIRSRQRMVDVFAVGHGFTEVPPVFFTFATQIILFRTADNIFKRKECLKDFDKMVQAQKNVNRKAEKNPHYYEIIKFS